MKVAGIFLVMAMIGCKVRSDSGFDLKGARIDQVNKDIDYATLFHATEDWKSTAKETGTQTLVYTVIFAYANAHEASFYQQADVPMATSDQATNAAYDLIKWMVAQNNDSGKSLLAQEPDPTSVLELPGNPQPLPAKGVALDPTTLYAYRATLGQTKVVFDNHGKTDAKIVDIDFRVYVGRNVDPARGYAMPDNYTEALAQAMVSSDVMIYNGHIWSTDTTFRRFHPGVDRQIPADQNTQKLAQRIGKLGGRNKYGVFFINACHGETIERYLMNELIGRNKDRSRDPLLLSHRNYSNYGLFASHNTTFFENFVNGQALGKVIYDLTPRLDNAGQLTAGSPLLKPGQVGDLVTKLNAYYNSPAVKASQQSVIIVAYDYALAGTESGRTQ